MTEFVVPYQDPDYKDDDWLKRRAGMNKYLTVNLLTEKQKTFIPTLLDPDSGPEDFEALRQEILEHSRYLSKIGWVPKRDGGDMVNQPSHYSRFKLEPTRYAMEYGLNWCEGNALKYLTRFPFKNGVEDLNKAARYLEMYVKWLNGEEDWSE